MATLVAGDRPTERLSTSVSYARFAGVCAVLAGAAGFLYSVVFVVLRSAPLSAVFLLLGGLLGMAALVGVYGRLRATDADFAMWGLLLGVAGALGAAVHAGYDLANAVNPPATVNVDLPSQIDPRGLLTFGVAGLGVWVVAWLMLRGNFFPRGLAYLGYLGAVLLIATYLARLIVLDATSPLVLGPALLAGFVVNPAWYIWLGITLGRAQR
jgi:hypothetical protein